jgi:hypothetical protein
VVYNVVVQLVNHKPDNEAETEEIDVIDEVAEDVNKQQMP